MASGVPSLPSGQAAANDMVWTKESSGVLQLRGIAPFHTLSPMAVRPDDPIQSAAAARLPSVFERSRVYWFSGTGNALSAARWFAGASESRGVRAEVLPMEELEGQREPGPDAHTLVGFCYPTHGFAPPWLVLRFLWRFPRGHGATVFFSNTRAGLRLGPVWLPGLSGVALWWPVLLFALKGYRIGGSLPLDMPHSWLSFFPPNTRRGAAKLTERCQGIVDRFAQALLSGRVYHRWSVWVTLLVDLSLLPITLAYLTMGRFALAKLLYASTRCNDCRLCERSCPVQAIAIRGGRPFWRYTCESCMRCMNVCPQRSVQAWTFHLVPVVWGMVAVATSLYPLEPTVWLLLSSAALFPLYWILHQLWRVRGINGVFTLTTPTRYWGRYLARDVRVRDLTRPLRAARWGEGASGQAGSGRAGPVARGTDAPPGAEERAARARQ